VESAPAVNDPITGGEGVITLGNGLAAGAEQEARDIALVLKTGALPVELERSQVETVSATLGSESLRQGLIAGIAGLILLCLYLAFYYRLLGVVTWFGMAIWAILAVAMVSLLGQAVGYSLTLAGVAGIVISLGITADSYIVFYERVKDEVRKGKTVRAAVGPAFRRAWRTIVAADIVTIVAAVVLYFLAIGSVRGFALTLGLATLLDMFVVYFFKRPTVFLIARSRRLTELPGMGLRSGVVIGPGPQPAPVRGGSR
jgi:preprotein translocase subunit SecD